MSDINEIHLVGILAYDPDSKSVNDSLVCNFKVKTSTKKSNRDHNATIPCVAWNNPARVVKAAKSGDRIEVLGTWKNRSYKNRSGDEVWVTECEALNVKLLRDDTPPVGVPAVEEYADDDVPF